MRLNWKIPRLALAVLMPLVAAGCGGVSANQTVSPASFFLPGLLHNSAPTNAVPEISPSVSVEIAFVK